MLIVARSSHLAMLALLNLPSRFAAARLANSMTLNLRNWLSIPGAPCVVSFADDIIIQSDGMQKFMHLALIHMTIK